MQRNSFFLPGSLTTTSRYFGFGNFLHRNVLRTRRLKRWPRLRGSSLTAARPRPRLLFPRTVRRPPSPRTIYGRRARRTQECTPASGHLSRGMWNPDSSSRELHPIVVASAPGRVSADFHVVIFIENQNPVIWCDDDEPCWIVPSGISLRSYP